MGKDGGYTFILERHDASVLYAQDDFDLTRKVIERPSLTRQAGRPSVLALSGPPGGRRPHAHSQTTWIKPSQARGGSTLSGGRLPRELTVGRMAPAGGQGGPAWRAEL